MDESDWRWARWGQKQRGNGKREREEAAVRRPRVVPTQVSFAASAPGGCQPADTQPL